MPVEKTIPEVSEKVRKPETITIEKKSEIIVEKNLLTRATRDVASHCPLSHPDQIHTGFARTNFFHRTRTNYIGD